MLVNCIFNIKNTVNKTVFFIQILFIIASTTAYTFSLSSGESLEIFSLKREVFI